MYKLAFTSQFKKDYRRVKKRGCDTQKLHEVLDALRMGKPLAETARDHALSGSYAGFRECHIEPDWLLVYAADDDKLILTATRTGSHSDLF